MSQRPLAISPMQLGTWALGWAMATSLCIALLDGPAAGMVAQWQPWRLWEVLLGALEVPAGLTIPKTVIGLGPVELDVGRWAYALGLGLIALVTLAVPRWRRFAHLWAFVALAHLISRQGMVELKEGTGRLRPLEWMEKGGDMFFRDGGLSFPSGHVTYFASLIVPAVVALSPYHRWTRWLLVIPVVAGICRIAQSAHFLSDVTGALALVCLVCAPLGAIFKPWTRKP